CRERRAIARGGAAGGGRRFTDLSLLQQAVARGPLPPLRDNRQGGVATLHYVQHSLSDWREHDRRDAGPPLANRQLGLRYGGFGGPSIDRPDRRGVARRCPRLERGRSDDAPDLAHRGLWEDKGGLG